MTRSEIMDKVKKLPKKDLQLAFEVLLKEFLEQKQYLFMYKGKADSLQYCYASLEAKYNALIPPTTPTWKPVIEVRKSLDDVVRDAIDLHNRASVLPPNPIPTPCFIDQVKAWFKKSYALLRSYMS